jgi:hypothetical protein
MLLLLHCHTPEKSMKPSVIVSEANYLADSALYYIAHQGRLLGHTVYSIATLILRGIPVRYFPPVSMTWIQCGMLLLLHCHTPEKSMKTHVMVSEANYLADSAR